MTQRTGRPSKGDRKLVKRALAIEPEVDAELIRLAANAAPAVPPGAVGRIALRIGVEHLKAHGFPKGRGRRKTSKRASVLQDRKKPTSGIEPLTYGLRKRTTKAKKPKEVDQKASA